jgi:hypothetical protein
MYIPESRGLSKSKHTISGLRPCISGVKADWIGSRFRIGSACFFNVGPMLGNKVDFEMGKDYYRVF